MLEYSASNEFLYISLHLSEHFSLQSSLTIIVGWLPTDKLHQFCKVYFFLFACGDNK